MNFLLSPNAMKGALSAQQIAVVMQKTLRRKYPESIITSLPIADGGNGTLECLMNALGGTVYEKDVTGPLPTITVTGRFGITNDRIAIIESADIIGLQHLTPSPESIAQSTSVGIGEIILAALKHDPKEIWIGLGGSAVNDGGAGLAIALGNILLDDQDEEIKAGAVNLIRLAGIHRAASKPMSVPMKVLADANNILLGETGATYTYARQKGATPDQLPYLENALKNFADIVEPSVGTSVRNVSGAGAAGGLGFGLTAFCNAEIVSGIDFILDAIGFDNALRTCDHVVTAEGMVDEQTLFGKGIAGICHHAGLLRKPVHAFVGTVKGDPEYFTSTLGLATLTQISPADVPPNEAMRDASWLLADALYHHSFSEKK